jgi:Response regulators consisting of a CheY-like receiver domain and a winged-helix DNA-binding domain
MINILVVEDDPDIQDSLKAFLENVGYTITIAGDGLEGYCEFEKGQFDLVLLDIMLPKIDGYAVCEMIRKKSQIPIIMLTAMGEEEDQLKGFDLNIDDYITKPFSMRLLIKRVGAVLRRNEPCDETDKNMIQYREIYIDKNAIKVVVRGEPVELTVKEFYLLVLLLENQGHVLTRETILNHIWGYDFFGDIRVVDTHIKNLRQKLQVPYIKTARKVGYLIETIT